MTTNITIIASGIAGVGCLHLQTEQPWVALDPRDDMSDFRVNQIYEVVIDTAKYNYLYVPMTDPNEWPLWSRLKWILGWDLT